MPGVKPGGPHPPHTTRYKNRPDFQLPPEAKEVIDRMWPEIDRSFRQYGATEGMLAVYRTTRDATRAAGWPDSEAYLIRDYILGLVNKAKFEPNFGSDPEFQVESAKAIVDQLLNS